MSQVQQSRTNPRRRFNKTVRTVKIVFFAIILFLMAFIGLIWFARPSISTIEKRTLTEFPKLTLAGIWDGSFFSDVDTWYADTYPLRESLISGAHWMESHYGTRSVQIYGDNMIADDIPADGEERNTAEVSDTAAETTPEESEEETVTKDGTVHEFGELQGNIYITDGAGYGLYYFSQSGTDAMASTINDIYETYKDQMNFYCLTAPISAGVMLDDKILEATNSSDEKEAISYLYSKLDPGIKTVNAFDKLREHNAEYIYFRTDHHWTALGSYYAYTAFCETKGITPHDIGTFETGQFDNYLGSYYSSTGSTILESNPDTVYVYYPQGTNTMEYTDVNGDTYTWQIISDVSDYDSCYLYMTFCASDQPYCVIHNENIQNGESILVVKDSYANAFIPWLVDHYEYIYWIDFRYTLDTIGGLEAEYDIDDLLFCMGIYNATSSDIIDLMEELK